MFALSSFLDLNKNLITLKKVMASCLLMISVCFIGLRYCTGADWFSYINYFNSVNWSDKTYGFGYKVLNIFSRFVVNDYYFCQFLATTIFCLSVYRFFYKENSVRFFLSLFLAIFFYFGSLFMAQVRQSLAIAILLFGSNYLIENKWIKYTACVCIATLFHSSAVFAMICLLLRLRFPKILQISLFLISFLVVPFSHTIIQCMFWLANFIPGELGKLTSVYMNSSFGIGTGRYLGLFFHTRQLLALLIIIFYKPKNTIDVIAMNALVFSCCILNISRFFWIIERLEPYVGFYAIIGLTRLFDIKFLKDNIKISFMALFLFITFFFSFFYRERMIHGVSKVNGQYVQGTYLPYWNVFFHPEGATRKDWNE